MGRAKSHEREEAGRRLSERAVGAEGTVHCPPAECRQYSRAVSEGRAARDRVGSGSGAPLCSPSTQGGAI